MELRDPRGIYHVVRSFHGPKSDGTGEFARVRAINELFAGESLPAPLLPHAEGLAGKLRRELAAYLERTAAGRGLGRSGWAFVNVFEGGRRVVFGVDLEVHVPRYRADVGTPQTIVTEDTDSHTCWLREVVAGFFTTRGLRYDARNRVSDAFAYELGGQRVGHGAPGARIVSEDGEPRPGTSRQNRRLGGNPQPAVRRFEAVYMFVAQPAPGNKPGSARVRVFYEMRSYGSSAGELGRVLGPRAGAMQTRLASKLPPWGQPRAAFVTALGGRDEIGEGAHGEGLVVFGVDLEVR